MAEKPINYAKDYPNNSNKAKMQNSAETSYKKIISGNATTLESSDITKHKRSFLANDASTVKDYVVTNVVVPSIKSLLSSVVDTFMTSLSEGFKMLLYPNGGSQYRGNTNASRVSYRNYANPNSSIYDRFGTGVDYSNSIKISPTFKDIIVPTREDAEDVLCAMDDIIAEYGKVSVAELYELVGIDGNYTDNKYGWYNLRNVDVINTGHGYLLKFPRAKALH